MAHTKACMATVSSVGPFLARCLGMYGVLYRLLCMYSGNLWAGSCIPCVSTLMSMQCGACVCHMIPMPLKGFENWCGHTTSSMSLFGWGRNSRFTHPFVVGRVHAQVTTDDCIMQHHMTKQELTFRCFQAGMRGGSGRPVYLWSNFTQNYTSTRIAVLVLISVNTLHVHVLSWRGNTPMPSVSILFHILQVVKARLNRQCWLVTSGFTCSIPDNEKWPFPMCCATISVFATLYTQEIAAPVSVIFFANKGISTMQLVSSVLSWVTSHSRKRT